MPAQPCRCQCKICRVAGVRHCHATPCGVPRARPRPPVARCVEADISFVLARLKAEAGSHSPSVAQIERALPGAVSVDACFLSNPYATAAVLSRLRAIPAAHLERMVSHYPSQASSLAVTLGRHLGLPAEGLVPANGACEVIHALLADRPGPLLLNVPTFSAYYEFAAGPVVTNRLDPRDGFGLDLGGLAERIEQHRPDTVVVINPNNPDGRLIPRAELARFLRRVHDRVPQIIVDESFSHFTTEGRPETVADLVDELPHLVVVNSLSKNYGIAGLRLGYALLEPGRARALRAGSLWNLNAYAEWFCDLLGDTGFQRDYELARRRYVRTTRAFLAELRTLPHATVFPSRANFALLRLERPAAEVAAALLARHGVYVRDCADKRGLVDGDRHLRIAARTVEENRTIVDALRSELRLRAPAGHRPEMRRAAGRVRAAAG